jgi:hypothetical protein
MAKEKSEHKDILGQPLSEGNYVAISHHNAMHICSIKKLSPKMMRVMPIKKGYHSEDGYLIYASQSVLLSGPDALAYILKNTGG